MVIRRVRLAVKMAMLVDALLAKGLLMLHAECVDWHVMLITIEHARLLLLGQTLIENLLRMVHLLLVVHKYGLLSKVD